MFLIPSATKTTSRNQTNQPTNQTKENQTCHQYFKKSETWSIWHLRTFMIWVFARPWQTSVKSSDARKCLEGCCALQTHRNRACEAGEWCRCADWWRPAVVVAYGLASQSGESKSALQLLKKPGSLDKQRDVPAFLQHSDHHLIVFRGNDQTAEDISVAEAVKILFV